MRSPSSCVSVENSRVDSVASAVAIDRDPFTQEISLKGYQMCSSNSFFPSRYRRESFSCLIPYSRFVGT